MSKHICKTHVYFNYIFLVTLKYIKCIVDYHVVRFRLLPETLFQNNVVQNIKQAVSPSQEFRI